MKKVVITLFCLAISAAATNAQDLHAPAVAPAPVASAAPAVAPAPAPDPKAGKFKFKEETHDYGEVPEGPLAECDFEFKNTGKKPIIISEAHGSCGCTVPKWPQEPVMPGATGIIHVSYNTKGRQGMIQKDVTINSNAQQPTMVLHIKGTVKPQPAEAAPKPVAN
jgi:hypothetical protein